jgi:hypothetical protein
MFAPAWPDMGKAMGEMRRAILLNKIHVLPRRHRRAPAYLQTERRPQRINGINRLSNSPKFQYSLTEGRLSPPVLFA